MSEDRTNEDSRVTAAREKLHALPGGKNEPETFLPLVPIDESGTLPSFPVEALPRWIADYAVAVAASTRFSVDMACGFGLGALSAALGGCASVMPSEDWREPINLYLAIVAEPSEGKSPVFRRMMAPIFDYDRELARLHGARFLYDTETRKSLAKRVEQARIGVDNAPGNQSAQQSLRDLTQEMAEPVKPIPRLAVGDVTAEQLGMLLQAHNEKIAILSPEDTLWAHMNGRYNDKSPPIEIFLSSYTGEPIRVDRKERSVVLDRPCLTICVAMQPAVLSGGGSKLAFDRGLLARFLYITPPRMVGTRDHSTDPPPIPSHIEKDYVERLDNLVRLNLDKTAEHRLDMRLTPAARRLWRSWQCELEPRRGEGGDLFPIRGWAGKEEGAVLRIAGCLALADYAIEVTEGHLQRAMTLVAYFEDHARAALGLSLADDLTRLAVRLLSWVDRRVPRASGVTGDGAERSGVTPDEVGRWFSQRTAWKENRSWLSSQTTIKVCDLLCDHGYLHAEKRGKARGYRALDVLPRGPQVG